MSQMAKIPWHFLKSSWLFPDMEKILLFPVISLTPGNPGHKICVAQLSWGGGLAMFWLGVGYPKSCPGEYPPLHKLIQGVPPWSGPKTGLWAGPRTGLGYPSPILRMRAVKNLAKTHKSPWAEGTDSANEAVNILATGSIGSPYSISWHHNLPGQK